MLNLHRAASVLQDYETAPGLKDTPFFTGEPAPAKAAPAKKAAKVRVSPF
jgi:hypothetical protein